MISHELRCIQVHIPKTAGVSIRKALFNADPDKRMHWYPTHSEYQKRWKRYFTFTIVRNPWDRLVSCYEFCFKKDNHVIYKDVTKYDRFQDFLLNVNKKHLLKSQRFESQMNWIRNKETGEFFGLDYVGKFESLTASYNKICSNLNINPEEHPLNFLNKTRRRKRRNYKEYYKDDSTLINIVRDMYAEEIEYFNYKYE